MHQPQRNIGSTLSSGYRYSFQGQEKDDEIKGEGNSINYTYRMHDPRVGRFFAVDPLSRKYPHYTPYSFSGNLVIHAIELEGLEQYEINIYKVYGGESIFTMSVDKNLPYAVVINTHDEYNNMTGTHKLRGFPFEKLREKYEGSTVNEDGRLVASNGTYLEDAARDYGNSRDPNIGNNDFSIHGAVDAIGAVGIPLAYNKLNPVVTQLNPIQEANLSFTLDQNTNPLSGGTPTSTTVVTPAPINMGASWGNFNWTLNNQTQVQANSQVIVNYLIANPTATVTINTDVGGGNLTTNPNYNTPTNVGGLNIGQLMDSRNAVLYNGLVAAGVNPSQIIVTRGNPNAFNTSTLTVTPPPPPAP